MKAVLAKFRVPILCLTLIGSTGYAIYGEDEFINCCAKKDDCKEVDNQYACSSEVPCKFKEHPICCSGTCPGV